MTAEDRDRRAQEAARIWNSQPMRDARTQIEATLIERFKSTPLSDADQLRWMRMLMEAHQVYDRYFQRVLNDGALARAEIERSKTLKERLLRR